MFESQFESSIVIQSASATDFFLGLDLILVTVTPSGIIPLKLSGELGAVADVPGLLLMAIGDALEHVGVLGLRLMAIGEALTP